MIGGAGMCFLPMVTMANIVTIRKRPTYQGYLAAVVGIGTVIRPFLGGVLTDWLGRLTSSITLYSVRSRLSCFFCPHGTFYLKTSRWGAKFEYSSKDIMAVSKHRLAGIFLLLASLVCLLAHGFDGVPHQLSFSSTEQLNQRPS
ncbi:hypothetical protein BJ742DRAFT_466147 [Cladochytrium replicatum]|nr:hypothetical protein BJ742DRAFT_466147 [Cladochytrium replicatum]